MLKSNKPAKRSTNQEILQGGLLFPHEYHWVYVQLCNVKKVIREILQERSRQPAEDMGQVLPPAQGYDEIRAHHASRQLRKLYSVQIKAFYRLNGW